MERNMLFTGQEYSIDQNRYIVHNTTMRQVGRFSRNFDAIEIYPNLGLVYLPWLFEIMSHVDAHCLKLKALAEKTE
jgi:hypothetical protein